MDAAPRLIGIAGPSGAGKTTLAGALCAVLPGATKVLSLDSYYRDYASLPAAEQETFNFDAPAALDLPLLLEQLTRLAQGHSVEKPIYDFATHGRRSRGEHFAPGDFLLVEGLFALYWEAIRRLYHLSLYVEADLDLCLERRIQRDQRERGRTRASVVSQYESQVRPMAERHVLPTSRHADLVVRGDKDSARALAAARTLLQAAGPHT